MIFAALVAFSTFVAGQTTPLTGSHTDIPRWCGKPYQIGEPNYDPGGMLEAPAPHPRDLLLLKVEPRHSIYVDSEKSGEFIVDAGLSRFHGKEFTGSKRSELFFEIREQGSQKVLVSDKVAVGTTGNVYKFDLTKSDANLTPQTIVLSAGTSPGDSTYTARTELYYLPAKTTGSMVKMDNLHGGMLFANHKSNFVFQPLLPFGFYTSCSGFLTSYSNVSLYDNLGFTAINPVCAFTDGNLTDLFNWMDELNVPYQYDMRGSFYNLTSVAEQVPLVKDRSGLLSWYTADEPDGWQYSFNSSTAAYDYLKQVDPYHPTGLVLNCQNYYFDEYSKGADYIMEDAYPIGINATFSKWGTPVNQTYGDCGCDNCVGALSDVSDRLDDLDRYQTWLGRKRKPLWTVAQAFSGEGYWSHDPSPSEAWAMNLLGFNHNAKAVMSWLFPASNVLNQAHSAMAKVFAVDPVRHFILGGKLKRVHVPGSPLLDVAYWKQGQQMMVSLVNQDYSSSDAVVTLSLPAEITSVVSQPWGNLTWQVSNSNLQVEALPGVATSVVIVDLGR